MTDLLHDIISMYYHSRCNIIYITLSYICIMATPPRKVLPPQPMQNINNPTHQTYGPFFLEYSLMAEYNLLRKQNLPGIYVIPSARSPLVWFGVIFIRHGLYQDGIFKFCVLIPANYPDGDCPRIVFVNPPFHPLIDPKSFELDVKRAFPKWKRNVNHIWNVLLFLRRIFFKIDTQLPLNTKAAALYESELTAYKARVVESIDASKLHLYDPPKTDDPYELRFIHHEEKLHASRKISMLKTINEPKAESNENQRRGYSWVAQGSPVPFSKIQKTQEAAS
ncbi:AKT-interacting protein-like isoform X1 [Styela clava]